MSNIGFSTELITTLCKPGRDATHLAICDGCDKVCVLHLRVLNTADFSKVHRWRSAQVFELP